jgi:hypothetical protein
VILNSKFRIFTKIKFFIWLVCHKSIPTRNLKRNIRCIYWIQGRWEQYYALPTYVTSHLQRLCGACLVFNTQLSSQPIMIPLIGLKFQFLKRILPCSWQDCCRLGEDTQLHLFPKQETCMLLSRPVGLNTSPQIDHFTWISCWTCGCFEYWWQ